MTGPKHIKVCGLTDPHNIEALIPAGITHIGFIFYKKTPRYVIGKLQPEQARSITGVQKTGVFVNADKEEIEHKIVSFGLDIIQLHGDESPALCRVLNTKIPVIKAFTVNDQADLLKTIKYKGCCTYYLFDAAGKSPGGNGVVFNWELLREYHGKTPFFLSGGIGLEEIEKLKSFSHPQWTGIDINSKFEIRPGFKNVEKVQEFLQGIEKHLVQSKNKS